MVYVKTIIFFTYVYVVAFHVMLIMETCTYDLFGC
jgi:hypothetical protein